MPLRLRLTAGFVLAMAAVLAILGFVLHARLNADLTGTIDMELRSRAQVVLAGVDRQDPSVIIAGGNLIDPDEAFAQVLSASGRIVDTSPAVAAAPMVSTSQLIRAANGPLTLTARVAGVDDPARVLVVPSRAAGERLFVVVGSTLGDRDEALGRLTLLLAIFGPASLVVVAAAGWLLAGAALRPVERMRQEASAISESDLDRRLEVPPSHDELARLGSTFNDLLARLEEAFRRESRFVDQASHELRTPLSILKMELDVAAAHRGGREELRGAIVNASAEVDRLVRLAEDLLVLARVRGGRLPVRRVPIEMEELFRNVDTAYDARARTAGCRIDWSSRPGPVQVDPSRLRQALEDLLDNALRHGRGAPIEVGADREDGRLRIVVRDHGPGFPPSMLAADGEAFVPQRDRVSSNGGGAGLGLAIVRAVAQAHGGSLLLENAPSGGARATLLLAIPQDPAMDAELAVGFEPTT